MTLRRALNLVQGRAAFLIRPSRRDPSQEELLSVQGASATSECLARRTSAMHDADTLIEIAQAEMMKSLRETGDGAMGRVDAQTGSSRGHQPT